MQISQHGKTIIDLGLQKLLIKLDRDNQHVSIFEKRSYKVIKTLSS